MPTKQKIQKISIILISAFSLFFLLPMGIIIFLYHKTFGKRETFSDDDYTALHGSDPLFKRTSVKFFSNRNQKLQGYFYFYDQSQYKGLIVLSHGIGGGHDTYLGEMAYLAKQGYLIFAYDNTGTNESGGKNLIGLSQSPIDLHHALTFLESLPQLASLPLLLYGHSWGGFAVCAVNHFPHNIRGIVSLAGFAEPEKELKQRGNQLVGGTINFLMPYLNLYQKILFGSWAKHTGFTGLAKTNAQVLLLHSTDDNVVCYKENFLNYQAAFGNNPRFHFSSLTHHDHKVTLTPEATVKFMDIRQKMNKISNKNSWVYLALQKEKNTLKLSLDPAVMKEITDFYDHVISSPTKP